MVLRDPGAEAEPPWELRSDRPPCSLDYAGRVQCPRSLARRANSSCVVSTSSRNCGRARPTSTHMSRVEDRLTQGVEQASRPSRLRRIFIPVEPYRPSKSPSQGAGIVSRGEAAAGVAIMVGLTLALYLPHVFQSGFYTDDYVFLETWRFGHETWGEIFSNLFRGWDNYRDGAGFFYQAMPKIGHLKASHYMAAGVLITGMQGCLFFAVLRLQGMRQMSAVLAGTIFVACPWIDASRIWMAVYPYSIAVCFYLGGLLCAQLAFASSQGRRVVAWHALSLVLFIFAVETFEAVIVPVAISVLLYGIRFGWGRAFRRWPADLLVAALGLFADLKHGAVRGASYGIGHLVDRGGELLSSGGTLISSAFAGPWSLAVIALVVAASAGLVILIRQNPQCAAEVRWWVTAAAVGFIFAVAGLAPLFPAPSEYTPTWTGPSNRFSLPGAPGEILLLIAVIWLVGLGLAALIRRRQQARVIATVIAVAILVSLIIQENRNERSWTAASRDQHQILRTVEAALGPKPARYTAVATFDQADVTPDGDPIFDTGYDLAGALHLYYGDTTLRAHAYGLPIVCHLHDISYKPLKAPDNSNSLPYGQLYFIDTTSGAATLIKSRAQCASVASALVGFSVETAN